jgi:hypothetical protein
MAKSPKVTQTVTPPPAEAPQPLASPYGEDLPMGLSQLRFGSKNNLRLRKQTDPAQPADGGSSTGSTGSSPGTSRDSGGSRPYIPRSRGLQL